MLQSKTLLLSFNLNALFSEMLLFSGMAWDSKTIECLRSILKWPISAEKSIIYCTVVAKECSQVTQMG